MTSTPQPISIRAREIDMPAQLFVPSVAHDDAAEPSANGTTNQKRQPGLVVLHDIFGLDEWTQQSASSLTDFGYVILAPDLYARSGGPKDASVEASLNDFAASLHDSHLVND